MGAPFARSRFTFSERHITRRVKNRSGQIFGLTDSLPTGAGLGPRDTW